MNKINFEAKITRNKNKATTPTPSKNDVHSDSKQIILNKLPHNPFAVVVVAATLVPSYSYICSTLCFIVYSLTILFFAITQKLFHLRFLFIRIVCPRFYINKGYTHKGKKQKKQKPKVTQLNCPINTPNKNTKQKQSDLYR